MSRHNRERRRRAVWPPEPQADEPRVARGPPRWFLAVFFTGAFAFAAMFASSAVFLSAVQPLVAPLVYHSTDGAVAGYGQVWDGHDWGELGDTARNPNGVLAEYTVEGQTFRCVGSRTAEPVVRRGESVRVYYPADNPDRGFVCDWSVERRWRVTTWPLAAFCLPFLTGALVWYWLSVIWRRGTSSLVRGVCLPFGAWLAGVFLGGAVGMLLADTKDMDHPAAAFLLQAVGGAVGGWWGLWRIGRRPVAPSQEGEGYG
jgi:hypothetical protein